MARGGRRENSGPKKGIEYTDKSALRHDLLNTIKAKGFDPLIEMLYAHDEARKLYESLKDQEKNRWMAITVLRDVRESALAMMRFVYPEIKSVEITGADGENLFQSLGELVKSVMDEKNK